MILGTFAFKRAALMGAATACLSFMGEALAGDKEKEPSAILEIGTAGEWGLAGGNFSLGPSVAIEFEPIKDWLEIEVGFAPLFGKGAPPEWSTDLLFKKPFTLSDTVEFMIGVGPEYTYTRGGTKTAAEFALDFMIWPSPDRKFGWFVEPTYSYSLGKEREQSIAVSVGLLIAIP
jgi:hypothetical protein